MAAITPTSVIRNNTGSTNSVVAVFSTVSDGDTWTSGIVGATYWNPVGTGNPTTQASAGIAAGYDSTTGIFTFYPGENSLSMRLKVEFKG